MKRRPCILLYCLCLCVLPALLVAQDGEDPPWKIVRLALNDEEAMGSGIRSFMEEGYYPVGLEIERGERVTILGEKRSFFPRRFYLQYFEGFETLPADFAVFLDAGWSPAAADFLGEGLLVLFIESDERLRAWQMLPVEETDPAEQQESINNLVATALEEGLEPFALSRWQEDIMIGFVTVHRFRSPLGSYLMETYPNDGISIVDGIAERLAEGYRISGYHFHEGQIHIGFFR